MKAGIKTIEPFAIGESGIIYSQDDAARVLKENSYYFIVVGFFLLFVFVVKVLTHIAVGYSNNLILFYLVYNFLIGYSLRKFRSRLAALLALVNSCAVIINRVLYNDMGGMFVVALLFLAVSYRVVKASFLYHQMNHC